MATKVLLLCLLVLFTADADGKSGSKRAPLCRRMRMNQRCRNIYAPVCGSDGITYENRCMLCLHQLATKMDVLIMKESPC